MSRSDFVDRLAGSLFLGKSIDLIISVSRPIVDSAATLDKSPDRDRYAGAVEGTLLGVQENRVYQVPRARLRASDIEVLDHFSITDGQVSIEILFTKSDPTVATF